MSGENPSHIGVVDAEQAGVLQLEQHGLGDLAQETVNYQGEEISIQKVVELCPHVGSMIVSMAENLDGVEGRDDIIKNTLQGATQGAEEQHRIAGVEESAKKK